MKKLSILFSFAFLFLVSLSADSFASCIGTPNPCDSRIFSSCQPSVAFVANTAFATPNIITGCTWASSADASSTNSCAGTAKTCASLNDSNCQFQPGCSISSGTDSNKLTETICNGLKIIQGTFGKVVAAFAIISVGVGFFTGKVSWGLMIGVTAGVAAMFGAPTIVSAISGTPVSSCS